MTYYKLIKTRHSKLNEHQKAKRNMKIAKRFMYVVKWKQRFFKVRFLASVDKYFKSYNNAEPFFLRLITWLRIFLFKYNLIKA